MGGGGGSCGASSAASPPSNATRGWAGRGRGGSAGSSGRFGTPIRGVPAAAAKAVANPEKSGAARPAAAAGRHRRQRGVQLVEQGTPSGLAAANKIRSLRMIAALLKVPMPHRPPDRRWLRRDGGRRLLLRLDEGLQQRG